MGVKAEVNIQLKITDIVGLLWTHFKASLTFWLAPCELPSPLHNPPAEFRSARASCRWLKHWCWVDLSMRARRYPLCALGVLFLRLLNFKDFRLNIYQVLLIELKVIGYCILSFSNCKSLVINLCMVFTNDFLGILICSLISKRHPSLDRFCQACRVLMWAKSFQRVSARAVHFVFIFVGRWH